MKEAGIREFRDHATKYVGGDDVVAVTHHGRTMGYYIPVRPKRDEEARQAMAQLREAVERVLQETGMTEDELVRAVAGPEA